MARVVRYRVVLLEDRHEVRLIQVRHLENHRLLHHRLRQGRVLRVEHVALGKPRVCVALQELHAAELQVPQLVVAEPPVVLEQLSQRAYRRHSAF